jgi:branched-chain amino acid transport system ATP-binding protein
MTDTASALLEVSRISKQFGGVRAVHDVSFQVYPGEIVGLIGPNGAGKTTLVNLITGVHRLSGGKVMFQGRDISRQKPHQAAQSGLARTFQIVQPFPQMSVLENVAAGALFAARIRGRRADDAFALEQLHFVGLDAVADKPARSLTLPDRKRLELAKSLAMRPQLLLLDEVNAGLNPTEIDRALQLIRQIAARGVTVILIEHLMKVVLGLSQRILVLHHGELISEGTPDAVINDPQVIEAYLGSKFAERQRRTTAS